MQILAEFDDDGDLRLIASTYSDSEFSALHEVLGKLGIIMIRNPARRDRKGREVREYNVSRRRVRRFEELLGGQFQDDGFFVSARAGRGKQYACREVAPAGLSRGCEEIIATDNSAAIALNMKRFLDS